MGWSRWYALRSYLRSTLWLVPLIALVIEQVFLYIVSAFDSTFYWLPEPATTAAATIAELDTTITLTISFIVFAFGSILVALQVASGQLTPRIIATALLQDNVIRGTVGLFIFSLLFASGTRARVGTDIPHLAVTISLILGIISVMAFLFLIDYTARLLRPVSIVWRIAEEGIKVIESVYPLAIKYPDVVAALSTRRVEHPERTVPHIGKSGIVLAINLKSLVDSARNTDGVIEFVHRVGDFVASGEPLFQLYGGATALDDSTLRTQVAFGVERTIEQDSTFAFRVIADIALKALSQAINDPTTAVLAIDQLHRLLRSVGRRHLHNNALVDAEGNVRLVLPTPNWEDFLKLAISEIRLYGAKNFQVSRRLRAMIENLEATLPEERQPAIRCELHLLDCTLQNLHDIPDDLALARQPDLQGLGGSMTT